ncbi:uncharacterized protein LOC136063304 [Quercus suber]|uniref:uncharacterized protein LOC136063304 n=1 Tax=Quercus suber TaxID=58331 RepID=UPI0032DE38CF
MENLAEKWNSLSLSEKEKTNFVLQRDQQTGEFMMAAQFLTPRFLNMEIMARTFKQLWRSTNGFKIRNQKDHRVLFVFDNLGDVDRILKNQHWSFDKFLVMLQRYNSEILVRDLVFKTTLFWIQVHDIPVRFMNRSVAEEICDTIGEVQKSMGAVDEEGGNFIRVRVLVDISLPFDKECELWMESKGTLKSEQQQFNSSLKAAPCNAAGKEVIYVPGFYEQRKPKAHASSQVLHAQPSPSERRS